MGRVVNSSNSQGFRQAGGPKQKFSIDDPNNVVHENPYVALKHALTSFMTSIALKQHVDPSFCYLSESGNMECERGMFPSLEVYIMGNFVK